MKRINTAWIIHIFALLHAGVALGCRAGGIEDELFLTILTMAMALIICMKKSMTVEFSASIVIVVNILGYFIGTFGASLLEMFISSPFIVHAISTAITTEILGWSIIMISGLFRQGASDEKGSMLSASYMKWILLAAGGIFIFRLAIVLFLSDLFAGTGGLSAMTGKVLSNSVGLTIIICINILFVRYAVKKIRLLPQWSKTLIYASYMLSMALFETSLTGMHFPLSGNTPLIENFAPLFLVSLLVQITIFCLIYMINYAITTGIEMKEERE